MFLLKGALSLIINRLSFNFSKNSKWSATELFLGLNGFLVSGDIPVC